MTREKQEEISLQWDNIEKDNFINILNDKIKTSIKINCNYGECDYIKSYKEIFKLLVLFNVESVRRNGEQTQWFPFDKFKVKNNGKVMWSLEHIHAQHSEGMKTQEEWKLWLELHLKSIKTVMPENNTLIQKIQTCLDNPKLNRTEFENVQSEIIDILSETTKYNKHCIANLALLNGTDNSVLNNCTFDVKRNKIIEMDQKGMYIPFCTRMVFLKYYTHSEDTQLHFWGQNDMEAYVTKMNEVLAEYLDGNEINLEMEVSEND